MTDRSKPILLYDGDCRVCCWALARWQKRNLDRMDYAPYQEAGKDFPGISLQQFDESVQLVLPSGEVFAGAEAVFRTMALDSRSQGWLRAYKHVPAFAPVSEMMYLLISRNRGLLSKWIGSP